MATKNLGKVFMTPKGQWDKTLSYTKLDIVTNKVGKISCGYIATTDIEKNVEITDNRWLKLFELLDGDLTDEQVQNAVNNYMAANPIDETDPTVSDWAKKEFGSGLIVTEDGRLSVDTVNTVEENNMKPITSDAVYKVIGNIETALAAI